MSIFPDPPLFSKKFLRVCCGLLAGSLFIPAISAQIREPTEFELKAALLYNFALFTDWPLSSGSTFNVCLYGQDPYGDAIQVLTQKFIQDRQVHIDYPQQLADIDNCHILYIHSSEFSKVESLITQIGAKPILTIIDIPGDNHHAGIIHLAMERQKIRFDVDLLAANRAGLSFSSKLLRLAREVHQ